MVDDGVPYTEHDQLNSVQQVFTKKNSGSFSNINVT